ncbi:MAG: serine hydrolase domain-containing protein [Phycisphaerales bacterium JB063]
MQSTRRKRIIWALRIVMPLVAIGCLVVFVPWAGVWAWLAPLPDTVQEQVDAAAGHGLDGIIVYVDRAGEPPGLYAAGWMDRDARVPADAHALFKIASISKLYIAAAAAKLAADERLDLDATLADLLPRFANRIEHADRITLRMMLRHRSGIPNFTDLEGFDWAKRQTDPADNLALALDRPADFAPDAQHSYSNTNYLLIGMILDETLGYPHQDYIRDALLAPLGLTHTFASLNDVDPADVASGYHHRIDDDMKPLAYATPGGSMIATAQDVGVFLRTLRDGSLLGEEASAIYAELYDYEHKGWLPGYYSIARYHADLDAVVVLLVCNTGDEPELIANVAYKRILRIIDSEG